MPWKYSQSTGSLKLNGTEVAVGYSGKGGSKNKPAKEGLKNRGPLPKGEYRIKAPRTSARTGSYVLPLEPKGHNALGRTDFQIHGDSRSNPGNASNGCIVVSRSVREKIWESGSRKLIVVK